MEWIARVLLWGATFYLGCLLGNMWKRSRSKVDREFRRGWIDMRGDPDEDSWRERFVPVSGDTHSLVLLDTKVGDEIRITAPSELPPEQAEMALRMAAHSVAHGRR